MTANTEQGHLGGSFINLYLYLPCFHSRAFSIGRRARPVSLKRSFGAVFESNPVI